MIRRCRDPTWMTTDAPVQFPPPPRDQILGDRADPSDRIIVAMLDGPLPSRSFARLRVRIA
jgi:hypothetical protein